MNNTVLCFHTLEIMHLPLTFLTHLSSLLLFLKTNKKQTAGTSHKKVFQMKTRDETLKNQLNKMERHHNTFTPSLHLVPFCQLCTAKKLFTHSLNEHSTQHCSLYSLLYKRESTSAAFISNKILQYNLNSQHTIRFITAHNFSIQDRLYLPCSVATTVQPPTTQHTPCTSMCTTHSNTLPTTFHNPPMHTTNKHKHTVGKMAQHVGMV